MNNRQQSQLLTIYILAIAAFIFNTSEFVPIGILPEIADSFELSTAQTGLMVTLYAWIVTLASIPLIILSQKCNRRQLILAIFGLFIAGNLLSAMATNFTFLLLSRILVAAAHAIFWAIAAPLALRLAPINFKRQAIGIIVIGSSLATILGIPIGTIIGQQTNWRWTFIIISLLASLLMLLLFIRLPSLPSQNTNLLKALPKLLKQAELRIIYLILALAISGYFTLFTYITPYMITVAGFDKEIIAYLLLVLGLAGMISGFLFGKIKLSWQLQLILSCLLLLFVGLISFQLMISSLYSLVPSLLIWGITFTLLNLALQHLVLNLAKDASDLAVAIFSGVFNIGIGLGAFIGSQAQQYMPLANLPYLAASFLLFAMIVFVSFYKQQLKCGAEAN